MTFDHVEDVNLKEILVSGAANEDSIAKALEYTSKAVRGDLNNEDVPDDVALIRVNFYESAEYWWNEEGNIDRAIRDLQECWKH